MSIKYYKLLDMLNRRGMTREDLRATTGISSATMAKLSSHKAVSLQVIDKICAKMHCQPDDIMEFIDDRGNVPTLKKSQINECKKVQLTFSEQVKILLDRKNMTVSSLADALGVSRQNLSNRLKTNNFDTDWMQKIADALGTKIIVKFD